MKAAAQGGGLAAAGDAALAGSGEPVAGICKPCELEQRAIPIVFVPGVMGSRITFTAIEESWDPDSIWAMLHWLRIGSQRKRDEMHSSTPAEVMTTGDRSEDELRRGYAGMANDFYVPFLRWLEGQSFKLGVRTPVYAVGYDWRQSNKDSGAYLRREVERILAAEGASQLVLISHSMGGMVTRSAMKDGLAGKVLGAVHIFQPVDGAVVLYRRFFTGMTRNPDGLALGIILGNTPAKFATISSGMPGPLQLLPTNNYRDTGGAPWLQYKAGGLAASWSGDVYELYTGAASPPALMDFASPPAGVTAAAAADLRSNVLAARVYHAALDRYQHPKTRTVHSTAKDTDMAILFDPPTQPPPQRRKVFSLFGPSEQDVPVEWPNRGAQRQHRPEGDGTVPAPSADPLKPNKSVNDVEHSAACDSPEVRDFVTEWLTELLS